MAKLRGHSGLTNRGLERGTSAPSGAAIGQLWFNTSTGVLYQYINDGTSSFWLDISSGGIGTSVSEGVDFVGDTDPHKATNGTGLAVGSVYHNREKNRYFVCRDATSGANVWAGRYSGTGGDAQYTYTDGGTNYRIHRYNASGTFYVDDPTLAVDILVVGGGGGGVGTGGRGAGGAGGLRWYTAKTLTGFSKCSITVGIGGRNGDSRSGGSDLTGESGEFSQFKDSAAWTLKASGGGAGGGGSTGATHNGNIGSGDWNCKGHGVAGGSGGGSNYDGNPGTGNAGGYTPVEGYAGGDGAIPSAHGGGGGGGAGGAGVDGSSSAGGAGGVGEDNFLNQSSTAFTQAKTTAFLAAASAGTVHSSVRYIAGGGGGGIQTGGSAAAGGFGGGGAGGYGSTNDGVVGTPNTGGGGGGGTSGAPGMAGGSGIVLIRYAI